ncbi:MMPL family transporter [Propionicicella superfundia]|uniref:MMPL family transporter n=1 Tax=Propionicicella superfundia TaxID=348582 RepID=UPI000422EBC7|nr:MMPL family transporter [Propionicicella superfundia]
MSAFLYRLGRACFRHRFRVLAVWLVVAAVLGGSAAAFGGRFSDDFTIPGAPSAEALRQLNTTFPGSGDATATAVVVAPEGQTFTDPDVKKAVESWLKDLENAHKVESVTSPYSTIVSGLVSDDGRAAIVRMGVQGSLAEWSDADRAALTEDARTIETLLPGSSITVGGDVFSTDLPHLSVVEFLGVVVAFVVLILTLGSLIAAGFPLAVALMAAGLGTLIILIGAAFTDVNSTTPMLAVMLGVAVGIDYCLFIVSRHRDQLRRPDLSPEESAARAVATAGSAVVFAGLTVIIALIGLFIADIPFLTVMGMFSAVTVGIAVLLANTLLPALLGFGGERLRPKPAKAGKETRQTASERAATWWVGVVTKVPVLTIVLVIAALGALSLPAKDIHMALPTAGQSAPGTAARDTYDQISEHFGVGANGPLILTGSIVESDDPLTLVADLKAEIEQLPGVASVPLATPNQNADSMMIQIVPETGPDDTATTQLVKDLRAHQQEWKDTYGVTTYVTGVTAVQIDVSDRLAGALFPFGVFVVGLSLVLLTVVFRSLWVPIKASLGYLLSIGSAFGLTTMVFNYGWFKEAINLHEAVPIISFFPIILMGILFGLAMDYEVFLVSRMREEHVHGNRNSVRDGFVHTAKVVVAAALIMFAVFAFFVPNGEGAIKPIAFGLAVGVAIDAFLVRMTLVPAVMALLGDRAWSLPKWLDRILPVMDIEGEGLAHQLKLGQWEQAAPYAVYGEGLRLDLDGVTLFADVRVALVAGQPLVVTGPPQSRRALLLAITGRTDLTAGELKVLGLVLPEQASQVRRRAEVLTSDQPNVAQALTRSRASLVAVDGVSKLNAEEFAALVTAMKSRPEVTWVLGTPPGSDLTALPPAPYTQVNLPLDRALARATN